MLARTLILSSIFTSFTAFAIPAFDGTYSCDAEAGKLKLRLKTVGNEVFLEGLDTGINEMNNKGMPCSNSTRAHEGEGYKIGVRTFCDDTSIGLEISLSQPSKGTNFSSGVKITKISEQKVTLSIGVKGYLQGTSSEYQQTLTCQKN